MTNWARHASDSERHFQVAVKENQDRGPEARYHYGRFLMREGRAADVDWVPGRAEVRFPQYELVRFEPGRAFYQTNQFDEAELKLNAAPSLEEARRLLPKIHRQAGK